MNSFLETSIFNEHDLVLATDELIRRYIRETPVEESPALALGSGNVWLKLENQQVTGSFKVRGALSRLLYLSASERASGVVACSLGNHGLGVAYASQVCGIKSTIFCPESIDVRRRRDLEHFDINLQVIGTSYAETEKIAVAYAEEQGLPFVSPYNDRYVIAGQGSIGIELMRQLPGLDMVVVAVGGGGLAAGVGGYIKSIHPHVTVVAVSPVNSAMMFDAVSGTPDEFSADLPTIADSTSGTVQGDSITIPLCKAVIDQWILVEEDDIKAAMRYLFYEHRLVVEGAGALAVAAYLREQERFRDANTALLVCGGNIDPKKHLSVITRTRNKQSAR